MAGLFKAVDTPTRPSKKSPGKHPQAAPDYRVKGRNHEHGRLDGWDYTVDNSIGCVWAVIGAAAGGLVAIGGAAGAVARAKGWA